MLKINNYFEKLKLNGFHGDWVKKWILADSLESRKLSDVIYEG